MWLTNHISVWNEADSENCALRKIIPIRALLKSGTCDLMQRVLEEAMDLIQLISMDILTNLT